MVSQEYLHQHSHKHCCKYDLRIPIRLRLNCSILGMLGVNPLPDSNEFIVGLFKFGCDKVHCSVALSFRNY